MANLTLKISAQVLGGTVIEAFLYRIPEAVSTAPSIPSAVICLYSREGTEMSVKFGLVSGLESYALNTRII